MGNFKTSDFHEQREKISWASSVVYNKGLVSAAGGNISARCNDGLLITGTNVSLRTITAHDLVLCNLSGDVQDNHDGLRPSKELKFHTGIYLARPEVNYIIHVHPCYSILWSMQNKELPMYTESAKMKLGKVPIIPDALPGTQELADCVISAVDREGKEVKAFLLEKHGIIVLGTTMEECLNTTELLEDTAKIAVYQELITCNKQ